MFIRVCLSNYEFYQSREALWNLQWWLHSGGTLRSHIRCGETEQMYSADVIVLVPSTDSEHSNHSFQVLANGLDNKLREDLERLKKIRAHRGLRHFWG